MKGLGGKRRQKPLIVCPSRTYQTQDAQMRVMGVNLR